MHGVVHRPALTAVPHQALLLHTRFPLGPGRPKSSCGLVLIACCLPFCCICAELVCGFGSEGPGQPPNPLICFSQNPAFGVQAAPSSHRETHQLRRGASPPASINEIPGGGRPFAPIGAAEQPRGRRTRRAGARPSCREKVDRYAERLVRADRSVH